MHKGSCLCGAVSFLVDGQLGGELAEPDAKSVSLQGQTLDIFLPKINTVQEYDLGKSRAKPELRVSIPSSGLRACFDLEQIQAETVGPSAWIGLDESRRVAAG